jgi:hypothetical protein
METNTENKENPLKDGESLVKRDERGRVLKGSILNPDGYTKGNRNFETDFNEAVDEIAQENGITLSAARKILIKVHYKNAKEGKFHYSKDIFDRLYGTATNKQDINLGGNVTFTIAEKLAERLNLNDTTPNTEHSN